MASTEKKAQKVRLITPLFRVSYPHVFRPKAGETDDGKPGKAKYSVCAIWEPGSFTPADKRRWEALLAKLDEECKHRFRKGWRELNPMVFKKGIRKNADREDPFEGFSEKALFANITSDFKPGIVDINGDPISQEEGNEDKIYPGCYARATVNVYSFDIKGKSKGVALGLNNIQVIKDGERLDNRGDAADDFDSPDDEWLEGDDDDLGGNDSSDDDY